MGQKIHPIGLRIGIHRKWNQTWFDNNLAWKSLFFQQKNLENFFRTFLQQFPYTKTSMSKKLLLVDLKLFNFGNHTLYLFIFFYKMRTKKRKTTVLFKKTFENKTSKITKKMFKTKIYNTLKC